jgi:hypothetical protein
MRDLEFSVAIMRENDVIHASKRDVPCIFRSTTSLLDGGSKLITLILTDTETDKSKLVTALSELHRILKKNNLPNTAIALKKQSGTLIAVYEIDRNKQRHHKLFEFSVYMVVQNMQILTDGRLVIGHQGGFAAFYLQADAAKMLLVHPDNNS